MIGRYSILREVGRGGMGVVYRAHDPVLNRDVALKTVKGDVKPDWVQRFLNEARALAKLRHPGIVPIHDLGEADGVAYFTMDLIEGKTLADALQDDGLTTHGAPSSDMGRPPASSEERARRLPATLGILADAALALGYAHEQGIVHRDLKPQNILLDAEGRPYVTDFGLAKELSGPTSLTESGAQMGTAFYMSPEQARGRSREATPATDVFALGVMLYEVLAGRLPFTGESWFDLSEAIVRATPRPPTEIEPSTPAELERICLKALEKDPGSRYATARELACELRRYLDAQASEGDIPTVQPIDEEDGHEHAGLQTLGVNTSRALRYVTAGNLTIALLALSVMVWATLLGDPGSTEQTLRTSTAPSPLKPAQPPSDARAPLMESLVWLARHQSPEGHWKVVLFSEQCSGTKCTDHGMDGYDTGVTGLALLAFLRAGYSHLSRDEVPDEVTDDTIELGHVSKRAIVWLLDRQDPDGRLGGDVQRSMYNHAVCTLALCEAYEVTRSGFLREPTQKAVDWMVEAQNPQEAWRYSSRCGDNDSSVTGWCLLALKSAERSGLNVKAASLADATRWIETVTNKETGRVGYLGLDDLGVEGVYTTKNQGYGSHETAAAVGMAVRMLVLKDRISPVLGMAATLVSADLPVWDKVRQTNDYCYWYWATVALSEFDKPGSNGSVGRWNRWREATTSALQTGQATGKDGCEAGSWGGDDRWGWAGGRVYATAINAMTMELCNRHPGAFHEAQPPK
ncbi:MAG: protein kinase [Planctomycetota bacterium]